MSGSPNEFPAGQHEGEVSPPEQPLAEILPPAEASRGSWQPAEPQLNPSVRLSEDEPLFASYWRQPVLRPSRFPNFADVGLGLVLLFFGWVGSGALLLGALHFHLFGISTIRQATADIHYTLGSQAAWYVISFSGCLLLFPAVWHTRFLAGVEWRVASALRMRRKLFSAVFLCLVLAMVDGVLIPGPANAPIDQIFRMPGAAWLLFAFGITLAPFFEELAFRGFLLPAFCTAYDWGMERMSGRPAPWPDENGKAPWSPPAMVLGSILTSIPFALMHAEQTGYSLGPFLLLICVSMVLCWVRLSARSLAASVMVHSSYNFLLFCLMLAGTGGFKHLDRL